MTLTDKLKAIADAIRGKTGKTDALTLDRMVTEIEGIETGGGGTDEIDALLSGDFTTISNDRITTFGIGCSNNTKLTEVYLPNVTKMTAEYAFAGCKGLVSVTLPVLEKTATYAFSGCSKLETLDLPNLNSLGTYTFRTCSSLKKIVLPKLTQIPAGCFASCFLLKLVDLPVATSIYGNQVFQGCSELTALILRSETMTSLFAINSFASTPIEAGTGHIYVPSALVDSYKTAANWSTFATQFRALEDYTVDGTITGELDSTKI